MVTTLVGKPALQNIMMGKEAVSPNRKSLKEKLWVSLRDELRN